MYAWAVVLACLACAACGRRLRSLDQGQRPGNGQSLPKRSMLCEIAKEVSSQAEPMPLKSFASLLLAPSLAAGWCSNMGGELAFHRVSGVQTTSLSRAAAGLAAPRGIRPRAAIWMSGRSGMLLKEAQQGESRRPSNLPWQGKPGQRHRFLDALDATMLTPSKFVGMDDRGSSEGSYRLDFTVPGTEGEQPKSLELLQSHPEDKPSFGAVRVRLPFGATTARSGSTLTVQAVTKDGNAFLADIQEGDIIRAINAPAGKELEDVEEATGLVVPVPVPVPVPPVVVPMFLPSILPTPPVPVPVLMPPVLVPMPVYRRAQARKPPVTESENGFVILHDKSAADYDAVLQEFERASQDGGEVILIIERPLEFHPQSNDDLGTTGDIFQLIEDTVETEGADLVREVGAVVQLVIGDEKLLVDLKHGSGAVKRGVGTADVTIAMNDEDFKSVADRELDGLVALMTGKMKINGSLLLAQKLMQKLGPILDRAGR